MLGMDRLDSAVTFLDRSKAASVVLAVIGKKPPGMCDTAVKFDCDGRFGIRRFLGEPAQTEKEKEGNGNEDEHRGKPNEQMNRQEENPYRFNISLFLKGGKKFLHFRAEQRCLGRGEENRSCFRRFFLLLFTELFGGEGGNV